MKIAIVGAGISGLLTAYLLKKKQPNTAVTLYEKSHRVGGHAHTVTFNLGKPRNKSIQRWVDLGVNDFNTVTYKNITALMNELSVSYKPLEDSTAFSTLDGAIAYVIDPDYKAGSKETNNMPPLVQKGFDNFSRQAPIDAKNEAFSAISVANYIRYRNQHNPDNDPDFYPADFVNYNLYPRINGMYFVHDTLPSTMSFAAIMRYYSLQEGFGGPPPQRVYVEGGTETWIKALHRTIQQLGVQIVLNASVQVLGGSHGAELRIGKHSEPFDAVVMACPASTALKSIRHGITNDMVNVLSQFDDYSSVAIAHTYSPLLPPDRNTWRTYNILIHGNYAQLRPYTISYVCNRHQNDAENPEYSHFGNPEFFVTLNPEIPIPPHYILKQVDGKPAIKRFTHSIVSAETLMAQKLLWGTHGTRVQGQNHLYFTGGWTQGAGLHEECFDSASAVTDLILGESWNRNGFYRCKTKTASLRLKPIAY